MRPPIRIKSIQFNSGSTVETEGADIVILVGPNNTGKSRALQEMHGRLTLNPYFTAPQGDSFVISDTQPACYGDAEDVKEWFRNSRYTWTREDGQEMTRARGTDFALNSIHGLWLRPDERLGELGAQLTQALWCSNRLNSAGTASRLSTADHPQEPLHFLLREPEALGEFRLRMRQAFSLNVVIDAWGSSVQMRVSPDKCQDDFHFTSTTGLPDTSLVERLAALSVIDTQSDGVRSFAGILLAVLSAQYPVLFLDEPEAFLHPPQARLLGRSLGELQGRGQVFVATHSLDVLLGLMEAAPERVLIVRLTRENGRTFARELPPDQLRDLWRDPLIRFSRVLDGLFHDGVVVCEGDTDSQFYSAVAAADNGELLNGLHVMFTYAGSKHRIAMVVRALSALGVPVRAIVDFDVLRSEDAVVKLLDSLGSSAPSDASRNLRVMASALRGSASTLTKRTALEAIRGALGDDLDAELDSPTTERIREALVPAQGWVQAKKIGKFAVPGGEATVATQRLLDTLSALGLWVVPSGAVESFVKTVPGKGPRWAVQVAEGHFIDSAVEAKAFVGLVIASLRQEGTPRNSATRAAAPASARSD